jgi:hypothetical protein
MAGCYPPRMKVKEGLGHVSWIVRVASSSGRSEPAESPPSSSSSHWVPLYERFGRAVGFDGSGMSRLSMTGCASCPMRVPRNEYEAVSSPHFLDYDDISSTEKVR